MAQLPPLVIPVFVSHLGCPHRCIFCDQRQFSAPIPPDHVEGAVKDFLAQCRSPQSRKRLLAYYGGSFTGIDETLREEYLAVGERLILQGVVHGLKASVRPDQIDAETIKHLHVSGFEELEVGAQSFDDTVLNLSRRGHGAQDTRTAAGLIKDGGLRLGIQYMPGLPGEDRASFLSSVEAIRELKPDMLRIYPTVVLAGTALEKMHASGVYTPLSLDEAITRTLYTVACLEGQGTHVIRMGLPVVDTLSVIAGPIHPSFGFMVRARGYYHMAMTAQERFGHEVGLRVHPQDVTTLLGFQRENLKRLAFDYCRDADVPRGSLSVKFSTNSTCLTLQDVINRML